VVSITPVYAADVVELTVLDDPIVGVSERDAERARDVAHLDVVEAAVVGVLRALAARSVRPEIGVAHAIIVAAVRLVDLPANLACLALPIAVVSGGTILDTHFLLALAIVVADRVVVDLLDRVRTAVPHVEAPVEPAVPLERCRRPLLELAAVEHDVADLD